MFRQEVFQRHFHHVSDLDRLASKLHRIHAASNAADASKTGYEVYRQLLRCRREMRQWHLPALLFSRVHAASASCCHLHACMQPVCTWHACSSCTKVPLSAICLQARVQDLRILHACSICLHGCSPCMHACCIWLHACCVCMHACNIFMRAFI